MNDGSLAVLSSQHGFITGQVHWNITDEPVGFCSHVDALHWKGWRQTPEVQGFKVVRYNNTLTHTDDTPDRNNEPTRRVRSAINNMNRSS